MYMYRFWSIYMSNKTPSEIEWLYRSRKIFDHLNWHLRILWTDHTTTTHFESFFFRFNSDVSEDYSIKKKIGILADRNLHFWYLYVYYIRPKTYPSKKNINHMKWNEKILLHVYVAKYTLYYNVRVGNRMTPALLAWSLWM